MAGDRSFTKPGADRVELEKAWKARLRDAEALLAAGRSAAAMAAGYYAVEILLKALICKRLDVDSLPRAFEIHDLESLLVLAGLSRKMKEKGSAKLQKNWESLSELGLFLNELRYSSDERWAAVDVGEFLDQLTSPKGGIIPWLSKGL